MIVLYAAQQSFQSGAVFFLCKLAHFAHLFFGYGFPTIYILRFTMPAVGILPLAACGAVQLLREMVPQQHIAIVVKLRKPAVYKAAESADVGTHTTGRQLGRRYVKSERRCFPAPQQAEKPLKSTDFRGFWSEMGDSNSRPDGPKPPALPTALIPVI